MQWILSPAESEKKNAPFNDSAYKSEYMGTIRNMLHKWENASQLGKCFMIGKMLLILLGFINLQILEFHSYMVPVYPYTQSNIIATDNHKIAWPFFSSNLSSNGFDTKTGNGWYNYICKNKSSKQCQTGTQIIYKIFECLCIQGYAIIKWKDCWMP